MATYKKDLKRNKNGLIHRYVGTNSKGHAERFGLGYDMEEAKWRLRMIRLLWAELQSRRKQPWTNDYLKAAKAIAKGKSAVFPERVQGEAPEWYLQRLSRINQVSNNAFAPANSADLEDGMSEALATLKRTRIALGNENGAILTGQKLSEAIDGFVEHLDNTYRLPDGRMDTWGKKQTDQIRSWRSYLELLHKKKKTRDFLNTDLGELNLSVCQDAINAVRLRPLTPKSKFTTRLTPTSAGKILYAVVNVFFEWLDTENRFDWTEPPKFHKLTKTPSKTTDEEKYERQQSKQFFTVADEHIRLAFEYALPIERVLLLLGLNCAFGQGEIGNLRIPFIRTTTNEIVGIRFKTGNDTRHYLWDVTLAGLEWFLNERKSIQIADLQFQDIVFVTDKGRPMWKKTKSGNYSSGIASRWDRLVKRIRKDHVDFPSYSFNKLRKTAATKIIEIADAESASMILAHSTLSEDELLKHYVRIPWKKLYEAQKEYGEIIAPLLTLDRPPFEKEPKNYIGQKKIEQIRQLAKSELSNPEIAEQVGVSLMTVHRYLKS